MKKIKLFTLLFCLSLLLYGCGNGVELQDMCIVMGVGVDIDEENSDYPVKLTVEVANYDNGSGGSSESKPNDSIFSINGKSVSDATAKLNTMLNKYIFWGHNKVIIFGKTAAEQGVNEFIDAFMRNNEMRPSVLIMVAEQEAAKVFEGKCGISDLIAYGIADLFSKEGKQDYTYKLGCNIGQYCEKMLNESPASVLPVLSLLEEESSQKQQENKESKQESKIYVSAYMVMDNVGKAAQCLDGEQQLGMCLWQEALSSAMLTVEGRDVLYSAMIINPQLDISYKDKAFYLSLEAESKLYEISSKSLNKQPINTDEIIALLEERLRKVLLDAFGAEMELGCDYLELAEYLHRHHKEEYREMQAFPAELLPPEIEVKVNLLYTGDLYSTI